MPMTASQRSLRAKIGAHTVHSIHDGVEITQRARAAFLASFEKAVDPDGVLPPEIRRQRADHALRAHMSKLSLAASRARTRTRKQQVS